MICIIDLVSSTTSKSRKMRNIGVVRMCFSFNNFRKHFFSLTRIVYCNFLLGFWSQLLAGVRAIFLLSLAIV